MHGELSGIRMRHLQGRLLDQGMDFDDISDESCEVQSLLDNSSSTPSPCGC